MANFTHGNNEWLLFSTGRTAFRIILHYVGAVFVVHTISTFSLHIFFQFLYLQPSRTQKSTNHQIQQWLSKVAARRKTLLFAMLLPCHYRRHSGTALKSCPAQHDMESRATDETQACPDCSRCPWSCWRRRCFLVSHSPPAYLGKAISYSTLSSDHRTDCGTITYKCA